MSPVAYLGNVFAFIQYRTYGICPGPVFRCEFNGGVRLVIGLTIFGNFSKYTCMYMFPALYLNPISTVMVIM